MLGTASQRLKTLLSFSPSILLAVVSLSLSLSLISSLEISLRRLSAGKLVSSAGPASAALPPTLTTERDEEVVGRGLMWWECRVRGLVGCSTSQGRGSSGEAVSSRGTKNGRGRAVLA